MADRMTDERLEQERADMSPDRDHFFTETYQVLRGVARELIAEIDALKGQLQAAGKVTCPPEEERSEWFGLFQAYCEVFDMEAHKLGLPSPPNGWSPTPDSCLLLKRIEQLEKQIDPFDGVAVGPDGEVTPIPKAGPLSGRARIVPERPQRMQAQPHRDFIQCNPEIASYREQIKTLKEANELLKMACETLRELVTKQMQADDPEPDPPRGRWDTTKISKAIRDGMPLADATHVIERPGKSGVGMRWSEAYDAMVNGYRMARPAYGPDVWVRLVGGALWMNDGVPQKPRPKSPPLWDLQATDWYVVDSL